MAMMTAYRVLEFGKDPEFAEVPVPTPGPGEVLLKMAAVGLCRSDLHIMSAMKNRTAGFAAVPPFTLGHENAGYVEATGPGAGDLEQGEAVLVSGINSCGVCTLCRRGLDNYCESTSTSGGFRSRGVGLDGGLAPYMIAPRRQVVRIGELDPAMVAPLADAGSTSYHAVKSALPHLVPGATAVVIGVGGLGGYAVQHLKLLCQARVIAVDVDASRLAFARELGAESLLSDDQVVTRLKAMTGGGAETVFDFVGTDETLTTAVAVCRTAGSIVVCGQAGGTAPAGWQLMRPGATLTLSLGRTLAELEEVVALAATGKLQIPVDRHAFSDIPQAYDRLRAGDFRSRIVIDIAGSAA